MNLVDDHPTGESLTHLGTGVVVFARDQSGSVTTALAEFDTWTGSRTRFTGIASRWAQLACSIVILYEPTRLIITAFERLHQDETLDTTLAEVALGATRSNQPLAVEVFFIRIDGMTYTEVPSDPTDFVTADDTVVTRKALLRRSKDIASTVSSKGSIARSASFIACPS